ncbi:MAG: hypothetical protein KJ941_13165 [Bacteroidetes bacterium]|nr:hypothetical protein [Bacteroidota bacterium]
MKNREIQKAFLEGIIPVLGYFYWEWGLSFILFFYFLDWIAKEVAQHLGAKKIQSTQGNSLEIWKRQGLISSLTILSSISVWIFALYCRTDDFSIHAELIQFLMYKEMGIPQGFILLPIIVLGVWMTFKYEFLQQKIQFRRTMSQWWMNQRIYNLSFLVAGILSFALISLQPYFSLILLVGAPVLALVINQKFIAK